VEELLQVAEYGVVGLVPGDAGIVDALQAQRGATKRFELVEKRPYQTKHEI
jgi:hypothetical protein